MLHKMRQINILQLQNIGTAKLSHIDSNIAKPNFKINYQFSITTYVGKSLFRYIIESNV